MGNDINIDITIPSQTRYLRMISTIGEKVAEELDCSATVRKALSNQLAIALTEGLVNAIKHANRGDPDKEIHLRINVHNKNIIVKIFDNGVGFDLEAVPSPNFTSNDMEDKGRGIFILRSIMDSVKYSRSNNRNVLEMRKKIV